MTQVKYMRAAEYKIVFGFTVFIFSFLERVRESVCQGKTITEKM